MSGSSMRFDTNINIARDLYEYQMEKQRNHREEVNDKIDNLRLYMDNIHSQNTARQEQLKNIRFPNDK